MIALQSGGCPSRFLEHYFWFIQKNVLVSSIASFVLVFALYYFVFVCEYSCIHDCPMRILLNLFVSFFFFFFFYHIPQTYIYRNFISAIKMCVKSSPCHIMLIHTEIGYVGNKSAGPTKRTFQQPHTRTKS